MRLSRREAMLKPWVGPVGSAPITRGRPVGAEQIQPGKYLIVKTRTVMEDNMGVQGSRMRSPFEVCRVRDDPAFPVPSYDHIGDTTLIPVEFLYADRYAYFSWQEHVNDV